MATNLKALIQAEMVKKEGEQQKTQILADERDAKSAEAQRIAERVAKLVRENPDMSAMELLCLWAGSLKKSYHKTLARELMVLHRLSGLPAIDPDKVDLKAEAQAAKPAKPAKKPTKK